MSFVFGSLGWDLLLAALFGGIGGLGMSLVQDKGLDPPRRYKEADVTRLDLGFVGDVLIGAFAALVIYGVNPPAGPLQGIAASLTAGLGGSAVLKSYVNGQVAMTQANRAETYRGLAWDAARGIEVTPRLEQMAQADEQMRRRWGLSAPAAGGTPETW